MKLSDRYSLNSLSAGVSSDSGRLFFNESGITDLSAVEVVGASVDTVRQLFYGLPKQSLLDRLQSAVDGKEEFFFLLSPEDANGVSGHYERFHLARMGKVSRYRFKLQNNDLGVVILFGSFFSKLECEGQHFKVELSPKFIASRSAASTMAYLHHLAGLFLDDAVAKGCSVHLACDYQGFALPDNFLACFSTHSRTVRSFDGLSSVDLSNLSEAVATYGKANQERNYLIGKPNSVQLAVYDKSYEIVKSDKVDFFHQEWGVYSLGAFDPSQTVRRIECRIHHQIIREIGQGMGVVLESFLEVSKYLTDIWRYALRINRLTVENASAVLHPFWQLLMQDVYFSVPAQNIDICRKKKQSLDPIARNFAHIIGNIISVCARNGLNTDRVMTQLKILHFYPDILAYYRSRGLSETDLRQAVERGLLVRRLVGKAA